MSEDEKKNRRLVKLSDGREVIVNLNGMTWPELRRFVQGAPFDADPEKTAAAERLHAQLMAQCIGLSVDEVLVMGYENFQAIHRKINDLMANPVGEDPN